MTTEYNYWLIGLSAVVAALTVYTLLDIALRIRVSGVRRLYFWLPGGTFAIGMSLWSMHFAGIVAVRLPMEVSYHSPLILAALATALATAVIALYAISRRDLSLAAVVVTGALIGTGIVVMHQLGVAARMLSPPPSFSPLPIVFGWIVEAGTAVALLNFAMRLRPEAHSLQRSKILVSAGVAAGWLAGHFLASAGVEYAPTGTSLAGRIDLHETVLAVGASLGSILLLILALLITAYNASLAARHAETRARLEADVQARTLELQRSNAELEQFAYVASHDLKEPLRTVTGFVQLLERRAGPTLDDKNQEYLQFVKDGVDQMQRLIDDLLEFSRVATSASSSEPATVDVEHVVERVRTGLAGAIETSGARILHERLPPVHARARQVEQLFQNLISNAIKFRAPDRPPEIRIEATSTNGYWHFVVRDNGIGIAGSDLDRIFNVFQRLHGRAHYEGTGIGLAICRKIVENHGGRIWAESTPGAGSAFHFTLRKTDVSTEPRVTAQ